MTYPRRCPLCGAAYSPNHVETANHATVMAEPGGTPSPWLPRLPGRVLTLCCLACCDEYRWDYFASAVVPTVDEVTERRPARARRHRTPVVLNGTRSLPSR
jgi:hypothetical protein